MTNDQKNSVTAYLSLGSNVGDRMSYLEQAVVELDTHAHIHVADSSRVYETEPWPREGHDEERGDHHPHSEGGPNWFLNQALKITTTLSPQELLQVTQAVEKELGRATKGDLAPRVIDIDILLYADEVIDLPELEIPHRHLHKRQFVLVPLLEISPKLTDPLTGQPFQHILGTLNDEGKVVPFL